MSSISLHQRFSARLQQQKADFLYRRRPLAFSAQQPQMNINGKNLINFSSNDYLGLANHPAIKQAVQHALTENSVGSGAAHLVTGHHLQHHLLEDELADWLGAERVLLFSTGYMANLAILQTLMQKGDVILGDKLNHASLIDGARLSDATLKRYPHLNMKQLENRLAQRLSEQKDGEATLVVTDGVFSMDGEIAPLKEIQALCNTHQAWLLVDDAHGLGSIGSEGKGCLGLSTDSDNHFSLSKNTILMGTLGKAFGCSGAFVAGSDTLIETLTNFARPYIYTTAMSPLMAAASREALRCVIGADNERQRLAQRIQQFRQGALNMGLSLVDSPTAIQPILLGQAKTALRWSESLKQAGFWVGAIRPPTVPKNASRLRVTLSAKHTKQDIDSLLKALQRLQTQENPIPPFSR